MQRHMPAKACLDICWWSDMSHILHMYIQCTHGQLQHVHSYMNTQAICPSGSLYAELVTGVEHSIT